MCFEETERRIWATISALFPRLLLNSASTPFCCAILYDIKLYHTRLLCPLLYFPVIYFTILQKFEARTFEHDRPPTPKRRKKEHQHNSSYILFQPCGVYRSSLDVEKLVTHSHASRASNATLPARLLQRPVWAPKLLVGSYHAPLFVAAPYLQARDLSLCLISRCFFVP